MEGLQEKHLQRNINLCLVTMVVSQPLVAE